MLLSVGEQKVTKESLTRLREKILAYAKSSVRRLLFYEGPFKSCFLLQFGAVQLSIWFSLRMCLPRLRWGEEEFSTPKNISASVGAGESLPLSGEVARSAGGVVGGLENHSVCEQKKYRAYE